MAQLQKQTFRRNEDNCIPGFQLVVVDVDEGISVETAMLLMKNYAYHIYTTKRHTDKQNRFRMVMPMSHVLKLDAKDYKEFMNNVYDWLPFEVDRQTNQRARKWLSNNTAALSHTNKGELLDVLPFIPKTKKSEEQKKRSGELRNLTNVEKWFVGNTDEGNRSNMLVKYALMLVDDHMTVVEVMDKVLNLNRKLNPGLEEAEVHSTILVTANKAINRRDMQNAGVA